LKSICQSAVGDNANVPQSHQEGRTTDAIEAFEVDEFSISQGVAVLSHFPFEMLSWHQQGTSKAISCFFLGLFVQKLRFNQAMG
jgi:hypothetical protein